MDLEEPGLGSLPIADSWTDFFSADQAEDPVLSAPSLLAQHVQKPTERMSQLMAAEPVDTPRASFSVQELVQVSILLCRIS